MQLPYFADSAELFDGIAGKPWSVFLDSGFPGNHHGRYDIIAMDPVCTLVTRGRVTEVAAQGETLVSREDPLQLLKEKLLPVISKQSHLPFNGGAIGYFSYDLARRLEKIPEQAKDAEHIPEMAVGIYQQAVVVDHQQQQTWLVGNQTNEQQWQVLVEQFSEIKKSSAKDHFQVLGEIQSNMTLADYAHAFDRVKYYLQEGDCYQVNLAQRFSCQCSGDPWLAYRELRQVNAAPFSSYLNTPDVQVLSSSPERFLSVVDGQVETRPIKGTRPRKELQEDDQQQISVLANSLKDRAENIMIVDLLRNDISKTCRDGSVQVPELFAVESYATVHHLVSTIKGILNADQHALDLLSGCFPGGSITGAPKIRAMEIIEELEPHRRGVYCGSVAYIGFDGNMDSNIAIRTMVHSGNTIRFWAGGGIVYDSVLQEEYQECFDKAAAMLNLLQQLKV